MKETKVRLKWGVGSSSQQRGMGRDSKIAQALFPVLEVAASWLE